MTNTLCPAWTFAALMIHPRVSSLKFEIFLASLRNMARHKAEGVIRTMRHRGMCFCCFLEMYLAWLKAVLERKVEELEMRAATISRPGVWARWRWVMWVRVRDWEVLSSVKWRLSVEKTGLWLWLSLSLSLSLWSVLVLVSSLLCLDPSFAPSRVASIVAATASLVFSKDKRPPTSSTLGTKSAPSSNGTNLSFVTSKTVPYGKPIR
mmetsp:Transcript_6917/g.14975  ORF Transcript_6917/g.14975 Transcript_6917/m.14975 type:complete len:207 (-) Transcript_6917:353-973(-)